MILVNKVVKNFGKLKVLKEVDLSFDIAKSYAFIGPNGSGKTTLIKSILGLVIPTSGDIQIEGESILNQWKYRDKIGYMPQIGRYPDHIKIGQLFEMIKNIRKSDDDYDEELINELQLNTMLDKRMHTLSGGTRQKVSAALAFLFKPPILILDEPTAGLDPVSVEILKEKIQRIRKEGKLLIITSHIMSDLDDMATEVVYLFDGNIVYNNSIEQLKIETSEERLGKAISKIITKNTINS